MNTFINENRHATQEVVTAPSITEFNKDYGSTTDLAPTLIGIYDSLLEPKSLRPEVNRLETAKDARNDPPVLANVEQVSDKIKDNTPERALNEPTIMASSVKLPIATVNKSSLYSIRTKSDINGASDNIDKCEVKVSDLTVIIKDQNVERTFKETKDVTDLTTFGTLSPNVKRMISSASETTALKFQKKTVNVARSSSRYKTNIPLVGATSKISQSGVEILPSVDIYDQPCINKPVSKAKVDDDSSKIAVKTEFKIDDEQTYDVPTNNKPAIYDVPSNNKTAFESLSLPYIDQSIELSITSNDREFDIKLSTKDGPPCKVPRSHNLSPAKFPKTGTNSLHRKDFIHKTESPSKQLAKTGPYPEAIGSTGNLKTYLVQDKEPIRLNPAVEVSRPLSMSSIASSSSTSSSGVQNKGGVNSAYLASIESLDDHSDADMTSGNGSNNFVNSAGILKSSISEEGNSEDAPGQRLLDEMSGLSQLERVCAEIVKTEDVYVEDLRQVVEGYLHIWRRDATFSDEELTELFNNIEHIYNFNRGLCEELNTCRLDATCIARCFVNNTSGFSVYTSYCTGYPRTMEQLAALASKPQSARAFRERQTELGHLLPLASYLLKPVQRILKYHLLLQNVVKECASRETEYALLKMTGIAQHIDDMKRKHEHAVRVQEIQSLLYGWSGPDLTTYGELCAEGTFRVFGAKAMRHVFLFDKMLLVTKNREDGILAYKSHIMCNDMMLVESIAGAPLSFHVIPWEAPRGQLTLQARSQRHKREWTLLLKRVILENYNAVIPSHARQLVMELGQNKTDDDILAEKSHNLITQASMRKQLSAPEYLEKRKLERERRKSFENGIRTRTKKTNRKYTLNSSRTEGNQECDCLQVSAEKGTDFTCDYCYIDLCSDCETELSKDKINEKCSCNRPEDNDIGGDKCAECDRSLHYIDAGSTETIERKSGCKCSDFKSSQESFGKEFDSALNKTRGYHSSDNIVSYTDNNKSKEDLSNTNNSLTNVRNITKTCLKCEKIKENIVTESTTTLLHPRRSRYNDLDKPRTDILRSKSKDDPQRSRISKIGTWRRKSEPGLQQNTTGIVIKKSQDSDSEKTEVRNSEKLEFECKNCGSNKITRKLRTNDGTIISDPELDNRKKITSTMKPNLEIRMYNTKNIPKKISKIKKNRAKGLRLGSDTTAKFYADLSTDVSTENILHISESNDSLNNDKPVQNTENTTLSKILSKDEDIDEETYKKLIEKTDSFKKNELEKVKYLNKQKVITEGSEVDDKRCDDESRHEEVTESCEETEQPLEQIISQLLMQNRDFQKLIKKQQQRNSTQRRHQRLMKSHSNPEPVILSKNFENNKSNLSYIRQSSDQLDLSGTNMVDLSADPSEFVEDDHIYETLRVDNRVDENLHNLDNKSKLIHHNPHINRPKRLPSPPNTLQNINEKCIGPDSDYVYLTFDKENQIEDANGIYDVPVKSPKKVEREVTDYYVIMEKQSPAKNDENIYDTLLDVCKRRKDVPTNLPGDYLPMGPDQQSPNTPEIWLSRQKEHFNVSRDRKSGSLPRSFQVITSCQEDNDLNTFKCKPNNSSKTYLNREGKVMSIDRPFTIASDQSEISYDDVETYMSEGDILKFNKPIKGNDPDYVQNISKSTLELEEEIDRCYKNNFEEINLDKNKNENITSSQTELNTSIASSCEVLPTEQVTDDKTKITEMIHPEHKIYKPTSNMLSLKNVLSRFKSRTPNKAIQDFEINANDQSSPDSAKSELKSPINEKKPNLNPRSYSKNLLQRFRSIIGDDHTDDNQNKAETNKIESDSKTSKNEIKVIITSSNTSPTTSTIVYTVNSDLLSKSVYGQGSITDSQSEKSTIEALSLSCENIPKKPERNRPAYEKSISMVTSISSAMSSPLKSSNSSYQSLNKLPIYMQGSKHLGARIAQSDYVDPMTLSTEKATHKSINILINKNAIRPDSLFSNSSFVTTSSEGVYQENKTNIGKTVVENKKLSEFVHPSDENYYEKSFETIEQVTDETVFRDSAVYSDQDDTEDTKTVTNTNNTTKVETDKKQPFKSREQNINENDVNKEAIVKNQNIEEITEKQVQPANVKTKIAPPVPVKPKITQRPTTNFQTRNITKNNILIRSLEESSRATKTIKLNNFKQPIERSISTPCNEKRNIEIHKNRDESTEVTSSNKSSIQSGSNIQIKRLSFERASLDSATRKLMKPVEIKKTVEPPKLSTTSKSVLERRMEIELLSKNQMKPGQSIKKPAIPAKSVIRKAATFERNVYDNINNDKHIQISTERNIPTKKNNEQEQNLPDDDLKGSWVKQVVNKFQ